MKIINKDITTVTQGVLVNGVNCQATMGSGVAKAYLDKWPVVKQQYMLWEKNEMKLGKFDPVIIEHEKLYIANCWTQNFYGYDNKQYADYGAILASVSAAALFAKRKNLQLYTPWVGCGLGGLEEERVLEILTLIEEYVDVPINICELASNKAIDATCITT